MRDPRHAKARIAMSQTLVKVRSSELRKKKSSAETPVAAGAKPTKTDLIRSMPSTLSPADVVEEAKKRGIALSANLVSLVRGRDRRNPGPPRRRGRPRKSAAPATHLNGAARATARPAPARPTLGPAVARPAVPRPAMATPSKASSAKTIRHGASLTARERELASILVEIGLDRVLELVQQLKRALDAV
jgi:hypothetical protein